MTSRDIDTKLTRQTLIVVCGMLSHYADRIWQGPHTWDLLELVKTIRSVCGEVSKLERDLRFFSNRRDKPIHEVRNKSVGFDQEAEDRAFANTDGYSTYNDDNGRGRQTWEAGR